ncbi:MAG: PPC domain-containing protein [Gemmataceae bacterium]|nr:PPC domain-containing protein [Gemmataceae bacterium]
MQRALMLGVILFLPQAAFAQVLRHPDPCLDFVYPAGAQRGQTVTVDLGGSGGLAAAGKVIVDGPPGISVGTVKAEGPNLVRATLTVAADAAPGRRWLRVAGGGNGLTNGRPFFIGTLAETSEKEPNNTAAAPQDVTLPMVVNGRIEKELDVDCFRFQAKAGQKFVAAILAHGMDSTVRVSFNRGWVDASLELLDDQGKVLAAADDTLGLDPVLVHQFTQDGRYTVRVQSLAYQGSAGSVYRLTLGDVPIPAAVFPAGGRRGTAFDAAWHGFNLPMLPPQKFAVDADGPFPFQLVRPQLPVSDGRDFMIARDEHAASVEQEPNDDPRSATVLSVPAAAYGRFEKKGDQDWFRLTLKMGQGVILETMAQRHLRSPVDTFVEVHDAAGNKLAENDDGRMFMRPNHSAHEFSSADSWLPFKAPQDGDYLVKVTDMSGVSGPSALYRLEVKPLEPELALFQWPDAVPIWGPGTTATFIVEVFQWNGFTADVELRVDGLPPGWTGSTTTLANSMFGRYVPPYCMRALLTITAPADAKPGDLAAFRVTGKATQDGRVIERIAQPMTLYGNSHNDGMLLRYSQVARAVVAQQLDCRLETSIKEITGKVGETIQIPVKIHRKAGAKGELGLVVNGPTVAAGVGLGPPRTIPADQNEIMLPLTIHPETLPGTRGVVVARSWSSDIRAGRPGPCTPIIQLRVLPK